MIDQARQKESLWRGGDWQRHDIMYAEIVVPNPNVDLLQLNDALERFAGSGAKVDKHFVGNDESDFRPASSSVRLSFRGDFSTAGSRWLAWIRQIYAPAQTDSATC